ncbi:helix-turn-helix transcriptional regulator [Pseudalkalibacillus sp. R45]|uniref:helix-turn-helix transcriptional regulator n=1 Tax=Pseudalkalibacillus sp. R45 TaxID=3457433 RepID=UPI003FCCB8BC
MKTERLLAIIIKLLNRKKMTAKELADYFEVSIRTIQRDIEAIELAGIPIVSEKGFNGGYRILDTYKLNNNYFNDVEHELLMTALDGVYQTYDDKNLKNIIEKLSTIKMNQPSDDHQSLILDFSDWSPTSLRKEKVDTIRKAIDKRKSVSFDYIDINGNVTSREIEPVSLILKINKWYVYAYCLLRQECRLFKLGRMREVWMTERYIDAKRAIDPFTYSHEERPKVDIRLKFKRQALNQLEDYFEIDQLEFQKDGSIFVSESYPEDEWVYGMILRFGDQVEVIEPEHIRTIIKERAEKIMKKYS